MTAPREEVTAKELRRCLALWEPHVCLVGNVRASEIVALCDDYDALRARLAAAEEAHAAMRDECSALRFDLRAALGERDEARRERDAYRMLIDAHARVIHEKAKADAKGPIHPDRTAILIGEQLYRWRVAGFVDLPTAIRTAYLAALDAAQATGREG